MALRTDEASRPAVRVHGQEASGEAESGGGVALLLALVGVIAVSVLSILMR